jgi:hypothetical protein
MELLYYSKRQPMSDSNNIHAWSEYQRLVLSELKRLDTNDKEMIKEVAALKGEIISLKLKAGMWGAVGASIPASVMAAVAWVMLF